MTMRSLQREYSARPSVSAFMLRALYPGPLRRPLPFPALGARWSGMRPDPARLALYRGATGLGDGSITWLHVLTFPLQMVILTAPEMPLPIWNALQVRNRLLRRRALASGAVLEAAAAVAGQRRLERGVELDLHLAVRDAGGVAWESLTTYLYRGRFGEPDAAPARPGPSPEGAEIAAWRTSRGGGLRFGRVSGDYNGVHWSDAYARRLGFRGAFHHPHDLVGQCLARLEAPRAEAQRLDLWFKAPVHYGSEAVLLGAPRDGAIEFALLPRGQDRPAILGRWGAADPAGPLGP